MAARKRDKRPRTQKPQQTERTRTAEATPGQPPWRRFALFGLALIALTLTVYAGVWSFDFVHFDDPEYVVNNRAIADGVTWTGIRWAFTTGYAANWHPMTWLSHMVDIELFGLRGGPPHLVNVLVHISSTLLLFWFLGAATGAIGRAAVVAALFAIHPLHVESVAWVSERKDVLSTLFWMLTLCAYLFYARAPTWRRYLVVMTAFALGLMAKPMLVTLPFALLLLDVWPLGRLSPDAARPWGRRVWALILEKIPLIALAAAASVVTYLVQAQGGMMVNFERIPLLLRVDNALVSYAAYIIKMIWPAQLYMFYPYPEYVPIWQAAACAAFLIAVTTVTILVRRRRPYAAVGWLWYLGTLVPVIGFVKVGTQAMADRFTYVPLTGLFVILVWGLSDVVSRWPAKRWLLPLAAGLVLLPCVIVAREQVQTWRNDSTLWTHALRTSIGLDERRARIAVDDLIAEDSFGPMQVLLFANHGGTIFPPLARNYLGRMFARHNQLDEAIVSFSEAIHLAPAVADFHNDLADALSRQGKRDAAVGEYLEALRLNPDLAPAHQSLGLLFAGQGKVREALPHFAEAVRLRPDMPDAHRNFGVALAQAGRVDEAVKEFREVLRLRPDDADVRRAIDQLTKRGKG